MINITGHIRGGPQRNHLAGRDHTTGCPVGPRKPPKVIIKAMVFLDKKYEMFNLREVGGSRRASCGARPGRPVAEAPETRFSAQEKKQAHCCRNNHSDNFPPAPIRLHSIVPPGTI